MNKRLYFFIAILSVIPLILSVFPKTHAKNSILLSPLPAKASQTMPEVLGATDSPAIEEPVNILVLGFDGRKGDKNPRCDTIHMITYDPVEYKITITTVPRGTTVALGGIDSNSNYLGNSCHIMGIDFAKKQIEKITGKQADYMVKVGFSQTLGILRNLNLPTTPTLQFLRSRRYAIGDNQRSHNQALFIKDVINKRLEQIMTLPKPVKYLIYKMTETNLPFETADSIIEQIWQSRLNQDPERIILVTKPSVSPYTKEIHYQADSENVLSWQDDSEFIDYQNNLEAYLKNLILRTDSLVEAEKFPQAYQLIKTPFSQELWLQIEDEESRNTLHFDMLRIYAVSSADKSQVPSLILDYMTEMESADKAEFRQKGEQLLDRIQNQPG